MPTKPITTFTLATDATFSSGPASGLSTRIILPSLLQGHIPGTGAAAEHANYVGGITGDWISDWLFLGTSAADEDAHIVETDSDGLASATRINVGGSTAGGAVPSIEATGPSTGDAPAIEANFTTGPNNGLRVTRSSSTAGSAALVQSTDSSGNVLTVISAGTNTGAGLSVTGQSGTAVDVTAGSGTAADITAGTGLGVVITSTDGNPAPLHLDGRDVPSTPTLGDVYVDDLTDFERLRVYHSSDFQTAWTTTLGFARDYGESLGASSTGTSGSFITKVSVPIPASSGLQSSATVHIRAVAEVGTSIAGSIIQLELLDATAPTSIESRTIRTFEAAGAADERYVVFERDYTIPSTGARTFELGFQSDGVNTSYIRLASLEITGQYD